MKVRLVIDPKWSLGQYRQDKNDPYEWGKWDLYVGKYKFYGFPSDVWGSFLDLINSISVEELKHKHNNGLNNQGRPC